ncbi:hypothetical protein PQX77_007482 [Marasmius sp. AFHP31]|nr:hypothetical protein PQX77_007482 [Marasmius sp. AFHP31]
MSNPITSFYSIESNQPGLRGSVLQFAHVGRDYNLNTGAGSFIVNNDNRVIQHPRPIRWYIKGTEEEEKEFDQYGEYRRSDIRLLRMIQHERVKKWDSEMEQQVLIDCRQSTWLGEILSEKGKGMIVTVVSYEGPEAPEKWRNSFHRHLERLRYTSNTHLLGLNRSRIPSLILLGELVPAAIFAKNIGKLCESYLASLSEHWGQCYLNELWMDVKRGVICRGPEGPDTLLHALGFEGIETPVTSMDLLKEDVLIRYLAGFNARKIDRKFMEEIYEVSRDDGVSESVVQPTVFHALTDTPIAVANNTWESKRNSLVEARVLDTGWIRFRLGEDNERELWVALNVHAKDAWMSQALSIFHASGILLDGDLSLYNMVEPGASFYGYLSPCEVEHALRLEEPIYLFFRPTLPNVPKGYTSSFHYWSFQESGRLPLPPEVCYDLGLPIELEFSRHDSSASCTTDYYKSIHHYQLMRGFDPTTTDFAQHLGYDTNFFHPLNDSKRFEVMHEGCSIDRDSSPESSDNTGVRIFEMPKHEKPISHGPVAEWSSDVEITDFNSDFSHSNEDDRDPAYPDPAVYAIGTDNCYKFTVNDRDSLAYADPAVYAIDTITTSDSDHSQMSDTSLRLATAANRIRILSTIDSNSSTSEFAQRLRYEKIVQPEVNDVNHRPLSEKKHETLKSQTRTCSGFTEKEKELITLTEVELINSVSALGSH